jgi:katanin p60 ATPase-containing subunit A1
LAFQNLENSTISSKKVSRKSDIKTTALPPISSNATKDDNSKQIEQNDKSSDVSIALVGTKTGKERSVPIPPAAEKTQSKESEDREMKLLKPMPHFENSEYRELASIITRDIFTRNPDVKWDSIAGLEKSKRLIKEAIVFPIKFPQLFQGLLKPWKGILLYGPPGTGKTMVTSS